MGTIKTVEELQNVPSTYKQTFQNKFTNSIDKSKVVNAKADGDITDRDVAIVKFLFSSRYATAAQIYTYLRLTNNLGDNENVSENSIKVRLDKLVSLYKVLNKFMLSSVEEDRIDSDALHIYCMDLGGLYLLHNFTNEPLVEIMSWRPRVANLHTADTVAKDIFVTDMFLKLIDTFGGDLKNFEAFKKMSYEKTPVSASFDFCIERDGVRKYYICQIAKEEEMLSRFAKEADGLEKIVSTNAWKKYYPDSAQEPTILFFTTDDYTAQEIGVSISERQIKRYRITTFERIQGEFATAFMAYNPDDGQLQLCNISSFERR
jgi:hypothetical protein